jgi:hypothetical protein
MATEDVRRMTAPTTVAASALSLDGFLGGSLLPTKLSQRGSTARV